MKRLVQSRFVDIVLGTVLWLGFATVAGVALTLLVGAAWQLPSEPGAAGYTGTYGAAAALAAWYMRPWAPIEVSIR